MGSRIEAPQPVLQEAWGSLGAGRGRGKPRCGSCSSLVLTAVRLCPQVNLNAIKRCLLISYNADTQLLDFRH